MNKVARLNSNQMLFLWKETKAVSSTIYIQHPLHFQQLHNIHHEHKYWYAVQTTSLQEHEQTMEIAIYEKERNKKNRSNMEPINLKKNLSSLFLLREGRDYKIQDMMLHYITMHSKSIGKLLLLSLRADINRGENTTQYGMPACQQSKLKPKL